MNELQIYGQVGVDVTAAQVRAQLSKLDQSQPLTIRIDSEGGSVFEGQSIAELVRSYPGETTAIIEPTAFSIASYIVMAADRVEIAENGFLMIHQSASDLSGTAGELRQSAELLSKLDQSMAQEYSRRSGQPLASVIAWMESETFFSASECLSYGFVDSVRSTPTRSRATTSQGNLPARVSASLRRGGSRVANRASKPVPTVSASAKWDSAISAALPQHRGNRLSAVKAVARAYPKLRALMVAEANRPVSRPTAKHRSVYAIQNDVEKIVAKLVSRGMDRRRAVCKAFADNPKLRSSMVASANTKGRL